MQIILVLLLAVPTVYSKLTCTKCPFNISPKGHTKCTETCEGDVCIIVVNKHFNGTIIANCIQLRDGDHFTEGPAICYREEYRTSCACNTKNHCNSPTSPIADFKFINEPFLKGYQLMPLISIGGESTSGQTMTPHADLSTEKHTIGTLSNQSSTSPVPHQPPASTSATYSIALFINCLIFVTVILF